jgi:hypothetical protein
MFATRRFATGVLTLLTAALMPALAPADPADASGTLTCSTANVPQLLNAGNVYTTGVAAFAKASRPAGAYAWEVGYDTKSGRDHAFIGRFAGGRLSIVRTPEPAGAHASVLDGVAATSRDNAWAVGSYSVRSLTRTLIDHWTGRAWHLIASPDPAGARRSVLTAVAARSAGTTWAVGYYLTRAGTRRTLIERWTGSRWQLVRSPNQGGAGWSSVLNGVTVTGASNAWAVGQSSNSTNALGLLERWNGSRWKVAAGATNGEEQPPLAAITATSAHSAWAVGSSNSGREAFVEHWDGTAWADIGVPNPGGMDRTNVLLGVAASSASNIWAVGDYTAPGSDAGTVTEPFIMHLAADGGWQLLYPGTNIARSQTYNALSGVTAINTTTALAVGEEAPLDNTVRYAYGAWCSET